MRIWRAETLFVPCLSLMHANLGKIFFKFSLFTKLTAIILLTLEKLFSKLLKIVHSSLSTSNIQKHHQFSKPCSSQHFLMKFKTNAKSFTLLRRTVLNLRFQKGLKPSLMFLPPNPKLNLLLSRLQRRRRRSRRKNQKWRCLCLIYTKKRIRLQPVRETP